MKINQKKNATNEAAKSWKSSDIQFVSGNVISVLNIKFYRHFRMNNSRFKWRSIYVFNCHVLRKFNNYRSVSRKFAMSNTLCLLIAETCLVKLNKITYASAIQWNSKSILRWHDERNICLFFSVDLHRINKIRHWGEEETKKKNAKTCSSIFLPGAFFCSESN